MISSYYYRQRKEESRELTMFNCCFIALAALVVANIWEMDEVRWRGKSNTQAHTGLIEYAQEMINQSSSRL